MTTTTTLVVGGNSSYAILYAPLASGTLLIQASTNNSTWITVRTISYTNGSGVYSDADCPAFGLYMRATMSTACAYTQSMSQARASSYLSNVTVSGPLALSRTTNQITFGTTNTTTLNVAAPSSSRTYTVPDTLANSSFVMTDLAQTVGGVKTFSDSTASTGTTSGGAIFGGGVGVAGTIYSNDSINVTRYNATISATSWYSTGSGYFHYQVGGGTFSSVNSNITSGNFSDNNCRFNFPVSGIWAITATLNATFAVATSTEPFIVANSRATGDLNVSCTSGAGSARLLISDYYPAVGSTSVQMIRELTYIGYFSASSNEYISIGFFTSVGSAPSATSTRSNVSLALLRRH